MGSYYNFFSVGEKFISSINYEIKKRNFYDEKIIKNWKYIVEEFYDKITPYKIVFSGIDKNGLKHKTLYVSTTDRSFATEFLFYKKNILEKLNLYFGDKSSIFIDIKLKVIF